MRRYAILLALLLAGCDSAWGGTVLGGATSVVATGYNADTRPASPSAIDDEFSNNNFTGWTAWNTPNAATESGELVTMTSSNEGFNVRGYVKQFPGGTTNFTVVTKWGVRCQNTDFDELGVMVVDDTASINDNQIQSYVFCRTTSPLEIRQRDCTDSNGPCTGYGLSYTAEQSGVEYTRFTWNNTTTTMVIEISRDGLSFSTAMTRQDATFTPDGMGFFAAPNAQAGFGVSNIYVDFMRFKSSIDYGPIGAW